jgi:hypothetical protein
MIPADDSTTGETISTGKQRRLIRQDYIRDGPSAANDNNRFELPSCRGVTGDDATDVERDSVDLSLLS